MSILTLSLWRMPTEAVAQPEAPPKLDWPLMGDVATVRAGVPEALILWRRARGDVLPKPSDRGIRDRFDANGS